MSQVATKLPYKVLDCSPAEFKRLAEWLLGGRPGDRIENWEMRRKQRKFARRLTPASGAILDRDHVKGHFNDYGVPVMQLYVERLAQFPIDGEHKHGPAITG